MVQKTSRNNITSAVLILLSFLSFYGRHGWKNHSRLNRTAPKIEEETHAHRTRTRSELSRERTLELRQ